MRRDMGKQQRDAADSGRGAAGDDAEMFELAPVSLWLEDYSDVRALFEEWRATGVTDIRRHLAERARVKACSDRIRVIKVNRRTLSLFEAEDLAHLVENIGSVFRDDMLTTHAEELAQLWDGATTFSSNAVNYYPLRAPARHAAQRHDPSWTRARLGACAGGGGGRDGARGSAAAACLE